MPIIKKKQFKPEPRAKWNTRVPKEGKDKRPIVIAEYQKKIMARLWQGLDTSKFVKHPSQESALTKRVQALSANLAGEQLKDCALRHGISIAELQKFKSKVTRNDPTLFTFLKNLFLQAALDCVTIFQEKARDMSATQAAIASGIFVQRALEIQRGEAKEFKEEVVDDKEAIMKIAEIFDRIERSRHAKVIDAPMEVLTIENDTNIED